MSIPHILLGTTREHYIMLFGAAGTFGLAAGFIGSWVGAYVSSRRASRAAAVSLPASAVTAAQLAPMMQALDAIALEVERISEAQRFTTKVLSERPGAMLPVREVRSVTPH